MEQVTQSKKNLFVELRSGLGRHFESSQTAPNLTNAEKKKSHRKSRPGNGRVGVALEAADENRSSFVQFDLRFEAQKVSQIAMSKSFIHVDEVEDRLEKVTFANIEEVISRLEDRILELTAWVKWLKRRLSNIEHESTGADMAFRCLRSDVKRMDIRILQLEIKAREEEEEKRAAK